MSTTEPIVMVCTVGGTPDPLRTSIRHHHPSHVIYLASPQSRATIRQEIENDLGWKIGDTQIVTLRDYQDMVQCVKDMREGIAKALADMSLPEDIPLVADITGGTKIMSAALALVMMEFKSRFSYVGGGARTKQGLGIVESGTEKVVQDANPWDVLALREVRALAYAFNHAQFADALATARALAENMDGAQKKFYSAIADMVTGYMSWDSFNHKEAQTCLSQAHGRLAPYGVRNPRLSELLSALKRDVKRVEALRQDAAALRCASAQQGEARGRPYLLDLVGNARRCAAAGHYDDAVARLYSAIEKCAKIALWTGHSIDNGHVPLDRVPASIRDEWRPLADAEGVARVGLEKSYQLLAALNDPLGKSFQAHGDALKKTLQSRNSSLLAHGYDPIGKEKYEKLLAAALEFLHTDVKDLPTFPHLDWKALL
ncbi:TIGR02710 family CRISPR-associated CARF protein [Desulfovibrio sp. ZJ200]|uniref:TIGR02710 family CRISPR-associated CARF protein n=1 Tax=Desulfovibrio sp. ZJ200 TaxID=2709792 RepID=UPI0013EC9A0E|nr:TIGR02710 family CRISPR-associated CARF protein [Desulfovibrio sp. ZJ200]